MTPVNKDIKYIDSFTYMFLQGQAFTRNEQAGCVEYKRHDRGAVTLRPLGEYQTDITFSDPARPRDTRDRDMQKLLKRDKITEYYCAWLCEEECSDEVRRLFEEVFQERLAFMQDLQNEYWTRLRQELSTLAVETENRTHYLRPPESGFLLTSFDERKTEVPCNEDNIFQWLCFHFDEKPPHFQECYFKPIGTKNGHNFTAYDDLEISGKTNTEYVLDLRPPRLVRKGVVIVNARIVSELNFPNIDVVRKLKPAFIFRFFSMDDHRIKLTASFYNSELTLQKDDRIEVLSTNLPIFWEWLWKELLTDYGLNEDGTPASKNENGIPAGKREKGNGVDVETRYEIFRKIKEAHPEFTYLNVADYANENFNEDLGEYVNGDTVKNTYRLTGHEWKRGKRAR